MSTLTPLVKPQISINGTARQTLVDQQIAVLEALRATLSAMDDAAPDGRDYQHRPVELAPAVLAWAERRRMVKGLLDELSTHADEMALGG